MQLGKRRENNSALVFKIFKRGEPAMSTAIDNLRTKIPDTAKDIRLNISTVLTAEGAPGLTPNQIWGTALACAFQTGNADLIEAIKADAAAVLSAEEVAAAHAASSIMAMNNVYYRTMHLSGDPELSKMPARLRMNVIGTPGIDKVAFETYCLAVSAMNGCGACVSSHIKEVKKGGLQNEGIHSAVRIASVINAVAHSL
jgi:lipoyl-dependent peroxiredoxin subunit D